MARVFTITQGLENMGAMKTGGQGSVYKGRRIGEIITAVKLLPTPIYNESGEDKNFRDFQNEVQKLKKVNEKPNPNVVKILSSGLSETGNFPFIEMEYIEGPDLEELLKPPHDPVFPIKEVIKVAEQLSNALAHCHSFDVKHGDIKSNNVKFNIRTGNYVLLDFGLAIMSEEQRRTSLRHAGAVEFMAPEQNEGLMFFQTDVYSFGVILFELLAGRVPFPLQDKGETARNAVRLAHMETLPPDVISLRKETMPLTWPEERRAREMNIPQWLVTTIYKSLNKKPENRSANGIDLHDFITQHSTQAPNSDPAANEQLGVLQQEKKQLQQQLIQYKEQLALKESEFEQLKTAVNQKGPQVLRSEKAGDSNSSADNRVPKSSFIALLFLAIAIAGFAAYSYLKYTRVNEQQVTPSITKNPTNSDRTSEQKKKNIERKKDVVNNRNAVDTVPVNKRPKNFAKKANTEHVEIKKQNREDSPKAVMPDKPPDRYTALAAERYTVISKAYFHTTPDESSRRDAFINPWNNAILTPQDDMHGFIYVVYTNADGQTSRGWLRKKDLKKLE